VKIKDDRLKKLPTGKQEASNVWERIASATTDLLSLVDRNYIYRAVNDSYLRAYNRSREEIVGHHISELLRPETFDKLVKGYLDRSFAGEQVRYQSWFNYPALGRRFMDVTYQHYFDIDGTISGVLVDSHDITDLHAAKTNLRQSEERYRTIMEEMKDGYFEVDLAGNFTFTNEAHCRNLGYSSEELIGMNYRADTAPEDVDKVYKAFNQIYLTGQPSRGITFKMTRKDGSTGLAEISAFPLKNEKDEIIGFRGVGRDVTEHAQTVEALRQSEAKYRTILEDIQEGYWETDIAGNFTSFNDAVRHLLGYSKKEMMGMNYRAYTSAGDVDKVYKTFNQVYRTGKSIRNTHYEIIRKDGSKRLNETSVFPKRNDKGEMIGFRGVSHDVTEHTQMEEALRRSEERYRTILDEMQDNYFEVDLAGNWTFVNDANCRQMGYSREEMIGMNYRAIFPSEDVENVYKSFNQVYLTGQPSRGSTFKIVRKDGSFGVGEFSTFPMQNENGEIIGFRGVGRDVTERMQMEEALRQSEERYRTILEETEEGYYEVDLAGTFTSVNDTGAKLLDHSREKLTGMSYRSIFSEQEQQNLFKAFNKVYQTGQPVRNFHFQAVRRDGSNRIGELSIFPARNENDEAIGFRGIGRDITERVQMEEALRRSEERYRTILEEIQDAYFEVDLAGNFTFGNPSFYQVLGYSPGELMGINYRAVTSAEDVEIVYQKFNHVYQTGKPISNLAYKTVRKDGSTGHVEIAVTPIRNEKGEIIGFRGVGRDVTERMQMDEYLRQSEERYRTILEEMQDDYFEVGLAGNFSFVNDIICRQLGYSREELIGMNFRAIIASDDAENIYKTFNRVYREGQSIRAVTFKFGRKDGSSGVGELSAFPLRNKKGEIVGFRGVSHDVTKRIQMEKALRQSEERYRTVLEEMQEPYFEMDLAGRFTFFNDSLCRRLGYSKEELMGMHYKVYTPPEESQRAFEAFNKVYRTGEPIKLFDRISIKKDGTRNLSETSVLPLRNEQGEIIGFRGLTRDLSERKKAEEERKQLEQKAQLASRLASVGELASGVAHEINNPLTGVIGYAHLLLARKDILKDMRQDVEIINEGAQRVAGIVKKLLVFARQTRPEQRYVNMNELIHTTLDLRAYELASSNIKVALQLARDLPMTIADPGQLQQVFLNLIINAETEMRLAHDKGKLSIKTEQIDNTIRISFKDNGPGIADENLGSIFDPFFTTREVGQGTGLGLSVCHGIVTEHKGRIWVESRLGKGATFVVELPIATEDKQLEMPEPVIEEPKKVAKAKILVVDDEPVIRQLVSQVLTEEGHQVETVDNAADALKMVKSKRYRLILLDIKMPGMSGIELYKQFKKIAPSLTKRVAFITGDVMGKRTIDFLDKTKTPYMMKPFDAKELKANIRHILVKR